MDEDWKEDGYMERKVDVYCLPCGTYIREQTDTNTEDKTKRVLLSEEDKQRILKCKGAKKKKQDELLRHFRTLPLKDQLQFYYDRNRAVQTHMLYFCSIADTAIANEWRVSYVVFRKRIKQDEIAKEQHRIQLWLSRQNKDIDLSCFTAITIGMGDRGYVYIYYISTSENELYVGDTATAFYQFMRKKDYYPIECKPFEKDPYSFLRYRYCTCRSLAELLEEDSLTKEAVQVIHSSMLLHKKQKTLKTKGARSNLQRYQKEDNFYDYDIGIISQSIFDSIRSLKLEDVRTREEDPEPF